MVSLVTSFYTHLELVIHKIVQIMSYYSYCLGMILFCETETEGCEADFFPLKNEPGGSVMHKAAVQTGCIWYHL